MKISNSDVIKPIDLEEATLPPDPNDYAAYVQL